MPQRRIRLHLTGAPTYGLRDVLQDNDTPALWDADGVKIQVFLADLEDSEVEFDLSTIESLTLEIRATKTSAVLLTPAVAPDATPAACTWDDWTDDDSQHAVFTLTGTQLNFVNSVKKFWLSIRATITGGPPVTFGAGEVTVLQSGHGNSTDPPATYASGYLYVADPVLNEDQSLTVTLWDKQFKLFPLDYTDA